MRAGTAVLIIWLLIGLAAAIQRDYFDDSDASCSKTSTIAVTIVAGPLNYVGANPRVECETPEPSK